MRRATFVTAIYVEMVGRKKKTSRFAKRPQASSREPMNGRSLGDRKKTLEKKKSRRFFPRRAKSRSFATRRRSLRGHVRACSLLFRRRKSSPVPERLSSLSLSHPFPLFDDAEGWAPSLSVTGEKL